jgi:hypothetical protein
MMGRLQRCQIRWLELQLLLATASATSMVLDLKGCHCSTLGARGQRQIGATCSIIITHPGGQCGTPPKVSGDMRIWLPFAIQHHATVIEMYYQDLGLAFDQNYCNNGGSQCYHLPTINGNPNPYTWYCEVGYGAQHGYNGCMLGCSAGGCYSDKVISAHGLQQ